MVKQDNPAGRLYHNIVEIRKRAQDKPTRELWAALFDVAPDSTDLLVAMAELNKLYDETIYKIETVEGLTYQLYKPSLEKIRQFINPVLLNHSWQQTRGMIDETSILSLAACSDWLSKHQPDGAIDNAGLDEIYKQLQEFEGLVYASEVNTDLKEWLQEQLLKIRTAVWQYKLKGPKAFLDALESTVGSMVLNREKLKTIKDTDEFKKYERLVGFIHQALSVLVRFKELAEPMIKSLSH